jgi:hypothetical protein
MCKWEFFLSLYHSLRGPCREPAVAIALSKAGKRSADLTRYDFAAVSNYVWYGSGFEDDSRGTAVILTLVTVFSGRFRYRVQRRLPSEFKFDLLVVKGSQRPPRGGLFKHFVSDNHQPLDEIECRT